MILAAPGVPEPTVGAHGRRGVIQSLPTPRSAWGEISIYLGLWEGSPPPRKKITLY